MKQLSYHILLIGLLGVNLIYWVDIFQDGSSNLFLDQLNIDQPINPLFAIGNDNEAFLDNSTWTDYPVDDTKNGRYNRLVIDLGEHFPSNLNYGVYGVLRDSQDNLLGVSICSPWDIRDSFQLSFAGAPINASGSSGPYIVWVGVLTDWWDFSEVNFTLSYTTSQAYNPNEFESSAATVIGFSDYANDIDDDDYFDEIVVELTLEVSIRGNYEAYIYLDTENPLPRSDNGFFSQWNGFLTPGEEIIEFHIPRHDFQIKRRSSPYNVSLITLSFYGEYQQFLINAYNTSTYFYRDFNPTFVELTGNYWDQGVDTDSDGKFDQLAITIEINVTEAGNYRLTLNLRPFNYDDWYFNQWTEIYSYWDLGIHYVRLDFDASRYYSLYNDTRFFIENINIYDSDWNDQTWADYPYTYTTRVYSYQEFDTPKVFLTGNYWDEGQDNDLDGGYDQLVITVEINVVVAGYYRLNLRIRPQEEDDWFFVQYNESSYQLAIGIYSINLSFDASNFYSLYANSSFIVDYIDIHDTQTGEILVRVLNPYITRVYNYNEFKKPVVFLTGNFWDYGEDFDSDGKFDGVTLVIEANFTESGVFIVNYRFRANTSYSDWSEGGEIYDSWDAGIYDISMSFDTNTFYSTHQNTSYYLEHFEIIDVEWNTISFISLPFSTRIYNYTEFDVPGAYFSGNYWDRTEDTDLDGKINFLAIDCEVIITRQGYYYLEIDQNPLIDVWDTGSGRSVYEHLGLGVHNVSFQFYVTIPYSLRLDTAFLFHFRVYDFDWNLLDWNDSPYITRIYSYGEFDPPGAHLTGNYWDYGVDSDSDGTYDQIHIDIEINVTQNAVYFYEYHWHSSDWQRYDWYADEKGFVSGLHNISVQISTNIFYSNFDGIFLVFNYFRIHNSDGYLLDRFVYPYETKFYSHQEIDAPGAYPTGNYRDQGVDTDFDGRYELVTIFIQIMVLETGSYTFNLNLYSQPTYNDFYKTFSGYWEEGLIEISVNISATQFYSNDYMYIHIQYFEIVDENGNVIFQQNDVYTTNSYSPNLIDQKHDVSSSTTTSITPNIPSWNGPFGLMLFISIILILLFRHNKIRIIRLKEFRKNN